MLALLASALLTAAPALADEVKGTWGMPGRVAGRGHLSWAILDQDERVNLGDEVSGALAELKWATMVDLMTADELWREDGSGRLWRRIDETESSSARLPTGERYTVDYYVEEDGDCIYEVTTSYLNGVEVEVTAEATCVDVFFE